MSLFCFSPTGRCRLRANVKVLHILNLKVLKYELKPVTLPTLSEKKWNGKAREDTKRLKFELGGHDDLRPWPFLFPPLITTTRSEITRIRSNHTRDKSPSQYVQCTPQLPSSCGTDSHEGWFTRFVVRYISSETDVHTFHVRSKISWIDFLKMYCGLLHFISHGFLRWTSIPAAQTLPSFLIRHFLHYENFRRGDNCFI